jgi:hypothetical protein
LQRAAGRKRHSRRTNRFCNTIKFTSFFAEFSAWAVWAAFSHEQPIVVLSFYTLLLRLADGYNSLVREVNQAYRQTDPAG